MRFRGYSAIESAETIMLFLDHGRGSDLVRRGGKAMCRATQKAACRVPVTCRCVTGVRPHTRHAPRGPECGAREQSAAVPPPRARPRPRVHLRSSAALSGSPLPNSDGPSVQRAPGEAPGKREREGRGGQGRAGAAHTHSVRNSYGGDKAHGHTGAFRGAGYPWPCGVSRRRLRRC